MIERWVERAHDLDHLDVGIADPRAPLSINHDVGYCRGGVHERLLAFTCKCRHLCPACHQRRVRQTAGWIATPVCHEVPHRQYVFPIPKIRHGLFRKRRDLLHLLFKTANETLQEIFRTRLDLPASKLGAIAAVHTFGKIFKAPDFMAAVIDHLPPKGKQTVRYHGLHSNKTRDRQSLIPARIIRPPESSPNLNFKSPIRSPSRPRPSQTIRKIDAPALARPHSQSLGS